MRRLPEGTCQPQMHIYYPPRKPQTLSTTLLGGVLTVQYCSLLIKHMGTIPPLGHGLLQTYL